jgi:hypothetical protein
MLRVVFNKSFIDVFFCLNLIKKKKHAVTHHVLNLFWANLSPGLTRFLEFNYLFIMFLNENMLKISFEIQKSQPDFSATSFHG